MHRRSACWRIGLAALLTSAVTAAGAATVEVTRHGREFAVEATTQTRASLDTAWRTLTDYERLPQFVPGLTSVRVLRRSQVDGLERLQVEQRGEFRWLFYSQPVTVRMDVVHHAPTRVDARAIAAPGDDATHLERFEGRYELESRDDGVRVRYAARIVPRFALPPLIGTLAVRQTVRIQFDAMLAEIERRSVSSGATANP